MRTPLRAVTGWIFYDLANTTFSLAMTSLYFPIWVKNVMGASDTLWGVTTSTSMAIIFFLSPLLGALTDQASRRMPFLVVSTLICVGLTLTLGRFGLTAALVAFVIANIAYQAGLQFYDSLLPEVTTAANRGRVGGIGIAAGYMGSFLVIAVGMVVLAGVDDLSPTEKTARYVTVFSLVAGLFLVFALPCFFLVREKPRDRRFDRHAVRRAMDQVVETARELRHRPMLARFLIGRAFYTDAVNTVIVFMGIYVTNAVGFTSGQVQIVMAVAIASAIPGGLAWGMVVQRIGARRTLDAVLWVWCVVFAWAAIVGLFHLAPALFWPVPVLAGLALGGTWTADRPLMLQLTPEGRVGEFYGLYGMVGRFSAVVGPLLWGFVSEGLGLGRPAAVATLLVFVIVAMLILRPLPADPKAEEIPAPVSRT